MTLKISAVVPAAGIGTRMGSDIPKQYLKLNNKTLLEHSVEIFLNHPLIDEVIIVINKNDNFFNNLDLVNNKKIKTVIGGELRYNSVYAGVNKALSKWVMIHDAARPCVKRKDLDNLIKISIENQVGAILATRVVDTLKLADKNNKIIKTVDRESLWRALTPQMFKTDSLLKAFENVMSNNLEVTDEAGAMELLGFNPELVASFAGNIKVTQSQDLKLVLNYLNSREK